MGRYVTVSVKIPTEMKEKLGKLGVKPSKLLRGAIEQELKNLEVAKIKEEIERLKPVLKKISKEAVTESIREDRERR
jgi:predicted DNA-binding protein